MIPLTKHFSRPAKIDMIHIDSIDDERVSLYTKYNEPQLYHLNEPGPGIFIAETPMVIGRSLDYGARPVSVFVEEGAYKTDAVQAVLHRLPSDTEVFTAALSVINSITGFNLTRGVLAAFIRPPLPDVRSLLSSSNLIAVLEGIVNPTNIGAIFRSAAALGVDSVFITQDSSDPFYRRATRVSMGTVFQVPWTYFPKGVDFTDLLHDLNYTVISMALSEDAISLNDPILKESKRRAIVFGAEGNGITGSTLAKSDHIVKIPMHNGVDSLNVAAASAVTFWELVST